MSNPQILDERVVARYGPFQRKTKMSAKEGGGAQGAVPEGAVAVPVAVPGTATIVPPRPMDQTGQTDKCPWPRRLA
jgi:hypothetical protein